MISFVINVANCSNDRHIGWPLWKQASTALVFAQPVSESTNKLSSCYHISVNQRVSKPSTQPVSKPSTQPVSKPSTRSQPVLKLSILPQPVSKLSTQPLCEAGPCLSPVMNLASPFRSRPAGFKKGWVVNWALTYTTV